MGKLDKAIHPRVTKKHYIFEIYLPVNNFFLKYLSCTFPLTWNTVYRAIVWPLFISISQWTHFKMTLL